MAANYQLPGSLEPPDYGEMARIGALQGEVEHRALSQLRREIGLRNMQRETAESMQAGVDPILARRNALFNNARFLFADNPQALVQLQNSEEARATRDAYQRALLQLRGEQVAGQIENWQALAKSRAETAEAQAARAATTAEPADVRTAREVAKLQDQLRQSAAASSEALSRVDLETGKVPGVTSEVQAELNKQAGLQTQIDFLKGPHELAARREKLAEERQTAIDQARADALAYKKEHEAKQDAASHERARANLSARLYAAQFGEPEKIAAEVDRLLPPLKSAAPPKPVVTDAALAAALKFVPGKTYVDAQGNKAVYQADGTWKPVK